METKVKISMYWLMLGIAMILHTALATIGIFFGKDVTVPNATGEIPCTMYAMIILTMILPFIIAFVQMNTTAQWFKWGSLGWSILLIPLNVFHFVSSVFIEKEGIDQAILLFFVIVLNFFLSKTLYKFSKAHN